MSVEFLESIWPHTEGTWGELRPIRNSIVKQEWFGMDGLDLLMAHARGMDAEGWDCYIGALPRVRASGKAEDCTPTTTVLWADLDNKSIGGSHLSAFLSLQKAGLEPSILVDSGNGIHAWWLLRQPIPFDKAQAAMRGLHKLIGSDSVHDAPRVLRLPGTNNHKSCYHSGSSMTARQAAEVGDLLYEDDHEVCKPVRLLSLDATRRYRWTDIADFVEEAIPMRVQAQQTGYEQRRMEYHALPHWLREKIEKGAPVGERSEMIWGVVIGLLERGWEDDEITALFMAMPIGEKVQDMTDRESIRYMNRTLERAREVVE